MRTLSDFTKVLIVLLLFSNVVRCFSFKERRAKVKRKSDSHSDGNNIDYKIHNKKVLGNITHKETARGFFPHGGLFSIGKVLNFFPVGGERECRPTAGFTVARAGICLNPYDCRQRDGRSSGDCAHGFGVCCVFEVTCGGVVRNNITYFASPGFPELWMGEKDCNVTIEKVHAGITQLRVDFVHFNIGQPNRTTGNCDEDVMYLGDGGNSFNLCGQNHGQHLYYSMSTATEARDDESELAGISTTQLGIRPRGHLMPRLWLIRLAQMPLAHSAPHDCMQYFTQNNGTIMTFNYAVNGRHLAQQSYRACVRRDVGFCGIRYTPCSERSFRIGPGTQRGNGMASNDAFEDAGPGIGLGPGTGFYGPDGSFVGPTATNAESSSATTNTMEDEQVAENDPVFDDGMMPVNDVQTQQDEIEGSGNDPQIQSEPVQTATPPPPRNTFLSTLWSIIWPSWIWGSQNGRSWKRWSPYTQFFFKKDEPDTFIYNGYGNYGANRFGYGRQRCNDRITITCENEYFVSNSAYGPGVCDPHHCGDSFCPGRRFKDCRIETSVTPFAISVNFGPPTFKRNAEENIGACLRYTQLPCDT